MAIPQLSRRQYLRQSAAAPSFADQPQAPAAVDRRIQRAGACGWAVNESRALRLIVFALLWAIHNIVAAGDAPNELDFFEKQVRPLLVKRCHACHAGTKANGGLLLDAAAGWKKGGESGPSIVPGKPDESLLIQAINYRSLEMPPPDKGGKLTVEEIAILTKWVAMGAPDPRDGSDVIGGMSRQGAKTWWAFQPLPEDGGGTPQDKGRNPIDVLIEKLLNQRGLDPAPAADKRTLIRRATYDLTGLPPTLEEVDAFQADESADAFDKVIDRLLESPQYGVRWGRHWLDVVRYADTAGENTDRPLPHAWRYRNWVIDAFNRNLPLDAFVRLQICGDMIANSFTVQPQAPASPSSAVASGSAVNESAVNEPGPNDKRAEGIIATGYLAIARRFGHDIDKDMHLTYEDVIDNLGKNFLGLSLGCARCHDHKYDPVTAEDYYALYGVFASTRFAFPGCEPKGQPHDLVPLIDKAKAEALTAEYQSRLAEYEQRAQSRRQEATRLKQLAAESYRLLAEATVGEGESVSLHEGRDGALDKVAMRKGQVLQLVVLPNVNHGADTTRVELDIARIGPQPVRWNVMDLIPKFTADGPAIPHNGATWCLLDVTDGPVFLHEKKVKVNGQDGLSAWSIGDTPSSLVNASQESVSVWTTLPGESFFIHPGHQRNVAVAWVCPEDGEYQVRGVVTDAHPAGLDGVSFRFEHIASAEYGAGLVLLGKMVLDEKVLRPAPPVIPVAYAVVDADAKNARVHLRGDSEQLGEEVPRRWLSVFGGAPITTGGGSGRLELADRIVEHPLFARVMVNRVWQWHFGRGLVATPNDFGSRGDPPTHPELLDWLAEQFRANGYRVKPLHRMMMKTAAYQRSSVISFTAQPQAPAPGANNHKAQRAGACGWAVNEPDASEVNLLQLDPENRWLARFSRRRLTAEEIRDSLLAAGGRLDLTLAEAHPFPPETDWNFTQHNPFTALYETNRRSVFLMVQRQRRHPFLALFDSADPNSSTATRQSTTVPTQALYFLNDPFFHEQAAACAIRIEQQTDETARIRFAFRSLFQREPTAIEIDNAHQFLKQYPGDQHDKWSAYARILMASNEYLYVD